MKILMTTDPIGGVWQFTAELARELDRAGHDVLVTSFGGRPSMAQRAELHGAERVRLLETAYRLEWMRSPWSDLEGAADWLAALADREGCDLLHFNCYGPAARAWQLPTLVVAHSCVCTWWRAVHGEDAPPEWTRYRACVAGALEHAQQVVFPSHASLRAVARCYPEVDLSGRASVIENGIDVARWPPGVRSDAPFVLGVGRVWDEGKNLRLLARVAERLTAPLLIAGDGHLQRAPSSGGALLLGRVSRGTLAHYYRRASVFAHPARYEPFGLVVLEAALSGCALVLSDIPTLRELWSDAALFVDPEDAAGWHAALQRLLDRPQERAQLGRRARKHALRYTARRMARAYLARYETLLAPAALTREGAA